MSEIDGPAFFGAVLRAVACTRNHNEDRDEYAAGVLEPAGRIRAFETELGDRALTRADAETVLAWLDTVFRTKRTPDEEREHHTRHIARVSGLSLVRADVAA
jgi:hypothetical protein